MSKSYTGMKQIKFNVSGLDEYTSKLVKMGKDIEPTMKKAVEEIKNGVEKDIRDWAQKHDKKGYSPALGEHTGKILDSVSSTPAESNGTAVYAYVGLDGKKHADVWNAGVIEYGVPGKITKDPGIREAFEKGKRSANKVFKKHFEEVLNGK